MGEVLYIAGSEAGSPKVWSWDGTSLTDLSVPTEASVYVRCLHFDGSYLFAGMDDGRVHAMDKEGTWTTGVFVSTDTTRDVCSVVEYDDGVNGTLYWILQGDEPDHAGGNLGVKLWYSATPLDSGSWTEVTGLDAAILGGVALQAAGGFLGMLTHSTGRLWVNRGSSGSSPVDATIGASWTNANAGSNSTGHYSFFWHGDLGEGYLYYGARSAGTNRIQKKAVIDGATWDDAGLGDPPWINHPGYGAHCRILDPDIGLLVFDQSQCELGSVTGSAEMDMPGSADGEPCSLAWFTSQVHIAYTAGGVSYLYRRQAAAIYVQEILDASKVFKDAVNNLVERTVFDHAGQISQLRLEPQVVETVEGDWVFLLGSEHFEEVEVNSGDKITLSTRWDFTASPLGFFGIFVRFRKHSSTAGNAWKVTVRVGVYTWIIHDIDWDFDQGWIPILIPTGKLTGSQRVEYILEKS